MAAEQKNIDKKWYVVHTYSGFENKAKKSLEEKIKQNGLEEFFGDILIPMENVVEMVKGEKRASKRKFFPGYILVQMELNDRTWHLVKNTPKITGFVGNATKPPAVSEHDNVTLTIDVSQRFLDVLSGAQKFQIMTTEPDISGTTGFVLISLNLDRDKVAGIVRSCR